MDDNDGRSVDEPMEVVSSRNSEDSGQGNAAASGDQAVPSGMSAAMSSAEQYGIAGAIGRLPSEHVDFKGASTPLEKRRGGDRNDSIPSKKRRDSDKSICERELEQKQGEEEKEEKREEEEEEEEKREEEEEEELWEEEDEPSISGNDLPKYAYNAQILLLTILKEMMEINGEEDVYQESIEGIDSTYDTEDVDDLLNDLRLYQSQRLTSFNAENAYSDHERTLKYFELKAYNCLITLIVSTLIYIRSPETIFDFRGIMGRYENLKGKFVFLSDHWSEEGESIDNLPDLYDGRRIGFYKATTQKLLLQTRNAFRELLLHISDTKIKPKYMNEFEEKLFPEDKCFLRRRIP